MADVNLDRLHELVAAASPRPWYFDGWDVFHTGPTDDTGGHRLVFPLPHATFHPSQAINKADAELAVLAVNEYEALVGRVRRLETVAEAARAYASFIIPGGFHESSPMATYKARLDAALSGVDGDRANGETNE